MISYIFDLELWWGDDSSEGQKNQDSDIDSQKNLVVDQPVIPSTTKSEKKLSKKGKKSGKSSKGSGINVKKKKKGKSPKKTKTTDDKKMNEENDIIYENQELYKDRYQYNVSSNGKDNQSFHEDDLVERSGHDNEFDDEQEHEDQPEDY